MMKTNKLREMLDAGKPTVATRINSSWPTIAETVGAAKHYDYVEFLAEYAPFDQYDLENIARACELHGMASIIKLDYQSRGYLAQRAMASGFQGVLFTDHRNAAEVLETLAMIRPECAGRAGTMGYTNRRWIGYRDITPQMDFVEMATKTVVLLMIEKKEALDNIDEICAVPGVDMVQFGPSDFAMSCGFNAKDNMDKIKDAEKRIIEAALKHNVRPRAEIVSPDQADYYLKLGVKDFALGSEIAILLAYWKNEGAKLREMMK